MKKLISIIFLSILSFSAFAGVYGDTHYVQSYTRGDGTYVQGHLAGNPGSGVNCHDNLCS
ncbi:MAG: hypothetical protein JXR42_03925 [Gammaproteobacteria bacterium]|nr:hypothetical protein [Gammaproteobacteria bacterium]